ncbi:hypothetical protein CBR_g17729 [Chara braunii]|uniref:Reverse transcriptase domain-containing protein n=1 Tax=Chara braunii TaxID=69332 RepID=A0A388KVJ2_CHABU|nr:hypothetical protein CBR_g17729 [Chara braunii]|eukprot:GBG74018.1 hypothetical protein CBR_g17729 [Chara braunii]
MTVSALGMAGQLTNESIDEYGQRFLDQLAMIEAEVKRQAAAAAAAEKQRFQAEADADAQALCKEAQDLLQRHETASVEKLKFWHFETSEDHDDATPEERHKEFLSKLVTRLVYTCNHLQSDVRNNTRHWRNSTWNWRTSDGQCRTTRICTRVLHGHLIPVYKTWSKQHQDQMLANPAVQPQPANWRNELISQDPKQLSGRWLGRAAVLFCGFHVVAMLGDIRTFAAPATISEQLGTLQTELKQLHQSPDNDRSTTASRHYKMSTFRIEKFVNNTHQDPVVWWQGFTTKVGIHEVPEHLYIAALFINVKGGCQIWLSHMATIHGVQVNNLHKKISREDLTREWKKRFIVYDAPMIAINRLFTITREDNVAASPSSPPTFAWDSTSWSRLENLDPLTFANFRWIPLPPTGRLPKPHCNVLMAQLRDYLHIAVLAPLMDVGVEVVDLHNYVAKIDREFKTQREAVSFDILDTKFDMILGMSCLRSEDHPVNFYRSTVHVRDQNRVLVQCTVPPPHPSISCHVVSAASIRASITKHDIEMGVCFLHALPPHDIPSTDASTDPRISELLDACGDVLEAPHALVLDRPIRHEIILEVEVVPPRGCIYRMSEEELSVLRAQLDDLLEKGWIRPSSSPYGAPVLFVRKKNKDLRLCIDYRKLNAQTVKNAGPLPRIDDLLERLGGAKFFSKLDLKSIYHQLEIRQEDGYKTTFKTRYGHFEWLVMPFGLTNAPATFQAAMTTEFRHMLDRFVLVYLDDILVYSRSLDKHMEHLRTVLERLQQAKYKANHDKCEFARQELESLGHYVMPQGIHPLADKIEAIRIWPEPTNTTDVRSFMGLAGYYQRFITGYSRIAAPLTRLQSPKVPLVFDDNARRSSKHSRRPCSWHPSLASTTPPCQRE